MNLTLGFPEPLLPDPAQERIAARRSGLTGAITRFQEWMSRPESPVRALDIAPFKALPLALQRRVLRAMVEQFDAGLEYHHVQQLLAMIHEIQRAVPAYAQPLTGRFGAVMTMGVEQAVLSVLDSAGTGRPLDESWANVFRRLGRVEFHEGRSLDSLQTAYRVGGRVAWRHVSARVS